MLAVRGHASIFSAAVRMMAMRRYTNGLAIRYGGSRSALRAVGLTLVIGFAAPEPSSAQTAGGFAGGFAEGMERGAAIRAHHAEALERAENARREKLCNAALENYLASKGPTPPPMCSPPGTEAPSVEAEQPTAPVEEGKPGAQASTTNCISDVAGGSQCTTLMAGRPTVFTNCSADTAGGTHCTRN